MSSIGSWTLSISMSYHTRATMKNIAKEIKLSHETN